METLRRRSMDDNRRGRRNPNTDLANMFRRVHFPMILMVEPTNKAVNVLEERLKDGVLVFDKTTNRSVTVVPICLRLGSEQDTSFHAGLHAARDKPVPQS